MSVLSSRLLQHTCVLTVCLCVQVKDERKAQEVVHLAQYERSEELRKARSRSKKNHSRFILLRCRRPASTVSAAASLAWGRGTGDGSRGQVWSHDHSQGQNLVGQLGSNPLRCGRVVHLSNVCCCSHRK